jgi:hypothetical protein
MEGEADGGQAESGIQHLLHKSNILDYQCLLPQHSNYYRNYEEIGLYLARKIIRGKIRYFIRESYLDKGCLRSRDLYDLGSHPERYIRYPGGNSYYIDEVIEEALSAAGLTPASVELDDLFWNFLEQEIRWKLEPFRRREIMARSAKRRPQKETRRSYHVFDKRRNAARWINAGWAYYLPKCSEFLTINPETRSSRRSSRWRRFCAAPN